ncbi:MAG: DUF3418 domain-containing protein, partial [Desulfobulbaceae bacterium]|nr:DUF3418 domain-containing protein [Desulfobulbaceae bacterium]
TVLLKSLPKSLRKKLIPVPHSAECIYNDIASGQGSFYGALEHAIHKRFRLKIDRLEWQRDNIPDHLRMRYLLVDMAGKEVNRSRRFADLISGPSPTDRGNELTSLQRKWQRDGISNWDFANLPQRIAIKGNDGQLRGFAYPALTPDNNGKVAITLTTSETEANTITRKGLCLLYQLQFSKQMKMVKKDLTLPHRQWQLYEGIGSRETVNAQLLAFALETVFNCRDGIIPEEKGFSGKIEEIRRQGLYPAARSIMDLVLKVLLERRQTLDLLNSYRTKSATADKEERFNEYRQQVEAILPPDFLIEATENSLAGAERYFKALNVRMERAHADPHKDMAKSAQVAPFMDRLNSLPKKKKSPEQQQLETEYRRMLEEFKVSLFAPEIKTAFPISAKRLDKKWQELVRLS